MKNPKITEEEIGIIKKAQAGDELAFNRLFKKYKSFVDNLLYHYVKDRDEAKDLTNVVFLKVHDKLSTFKAYASFGGWLRIIANRTAIDYLRRIESKPVVLGESVDRLSIDKPGTHAETDLVNQMTYDYLMTEFDKMSETSRKVCRLFYEDNMTVEQISKALRLPIGTIKSALSRSRRKLKNQLNI